MKTKIVMIAALMIFAFVFDAHGQSLSFYNFKSNLYLAKDSSLSNSGTKQSKTMIVFARNDRLTTSVNYHNGARVMVLGAQTNDSVHANIYIRFGNISGGTIGRNYARILVDSLTLTKNVVNIDLSSYMYYPEIGLEVVGSSAGNGYLAKWSAIFGGVGKSLLAQ